MGRGASVVKQYVIVSGSCLASLLAGGSLVHAVLKPDLALDVTVPEVLGGGSSTTPTSEAVSRGANSEEAAK